jgi:hypothetical protein
MRILRSAASIAAGLGFLTSSRIVAAAVALPAGNLAIVAFGAVLAGWLAARIAGFAPYAHATVVAAIAAVLSIVSASNGPAPQPTWHPAAAGLITVTGVLLGGKLRAVAARP